MLATNNDAGGTLNTRRHAEHRSRNRGLRGLHRQLRPLPTVAALLAIAVLCAAALGAVRALTQRPPNTLVMQEREVSNPVQLLRQAEGRVKTEVAEQHGTETGSTRCYFAAQKQVAARKFEITDRVLCGPALFLDGDPGKPYIEFALTSAPVGTSRLSIALAASAPVQLSAVGVHLIRPDGRTARPDQIPSIPVPPLAATDLLSTSATVGGPMISAGKDAVMIGPHSGVQLEKYGFVKRFGAGKDTRIAPVGWRLLAFSLAARPGELADRPPALSLNVDGAVRGPLLLTSDYIVTAVPDEARSVALVLTDADSRQQISLLTGKPSATNPVLSTRTHRTDHPATAKPVTVRVTAGGKTGLVAGTVQLKQVSLSYWAADGSHPSSPDRAFLHVQATVRLTGDREPYGAEAGLLGVALATGSGSSSGAVLPARNSAADPTSTIDDVVEVPAGIVQGTVIYSGTLRTKTGTLAVLAPVRIGFTIAPG